MISVSQLATHMPFITLPLALVDHIINMNTLRLHAHYLATVAWVMVHTYTPVDVGMPDKALGWFPPDNLPCRNSI